MIFLHVVPTDISISELLLLSITNYKRECRVHPLSHEVKDSELKLKPQIKYGEVNLHFLTILIFCTS